MTSQQFEIWIADLNPRMGTESGKTRPVLVVQTDLLNNVSHPSTIICPLTTDTLRESEILRVHVSRGTANLKQDSDIMIDQIRAIHSKRLIERIGTLPEEHAILVQESLSIVLDLSF